MSFEEKLRKIIYQIAIHHEIVVGTVNGRVKKPNNNKAIGRYEDLIVKDND